MNSPSKSWSRWACTFAAFAFAVASVGWSTVTLRGWLAERRGEPSTDRSARGDRGRGRGPEPDDSPAPTPIKALAALRSRSLVPDLTDRGLYDTTRIWTVHMRFTPDQWTAIEPKQTETADWPRGPDGRVQLRDPAASRNGLAGVRGIEFDWVRATLEFEGRTFGDAAVRYKGNGTYLRSQRSMKRPFKVDLDKFAKGASLAGRRTLNFANLAVDDSSMHDALGYELFRAAGVPAPRTAYARLFVTTNAVPPAYLGVYALVENIDDDFAAVKFGTRKGIFFKPVTTELFSDLGDDWSVYDRIYDPKTKPTSEQKARVIAFAKLLSHADDATFAARAGDFIDVDEFARFLSVMVLLSSYDGFLNNGQNFYLWLGPDSGRFQFLPWDLDNAWGKFGMTGSATDRAQASISHPWMGRHRLLERMMQVPAFQDRYRKVLQELMATAFVPDRLHRRVDEMAALLRPALAEESPRKLARFETAVTATRLEDATDRGGGGGRGGWNRSPHPLKWFITERARSVAEQLAGRSEGVLIEGRW